MKLCLLGKLPPTKGGIARLTYQTVTDLAASGHEVHVVTNAAEVEPCHRQLWTAEDHDIFSRSLSNVQIHQTQTVFEPRSFHIPLSPAYETKLFALAMQVIEEHDCDAIMGWYFQPFGVVASIVGSLTGKPVFLMHAGSDIGFLPDHPNLNAAFRRMVAGAHSIITGNSEPVLQRLASLGARPEQLAIPGAGFVPLLPEFTSPRRFDVSDYVPLLEEHYSDYMIPHGPLPKDLAQQLTSLPDKPLRTDVPTIGVYGKVGAVKSSLELVEALSNLANEGLKFNFVQLACGRYPILDTYHRAVLERPALASQTWLLPNIAPWRVPGFLDVCDVACFLENRIGISFHTPSVPREVLARGAAFVCSGEVADSGIWSSALDDGESYVRVNEPRDVDELTSRLRALIADPQRRTAIADYGRFISEQVESHTDLNPVAQLIAQRLESL